MIAVSPHSPQGPGSSAVASKPSSSESDTGLDPRLAEAAKQFEAVFIRQMLSSLEKTTGSSADTHTSGGAIYGSMVVNTVADAIANAGGLGLASLLTKSVQAGQGQGGSHARPHAAGTASQPPSNEVASTVESKREVRHR